MRKLITTVAVFMLTFAIFAPATLHANEIGVTIYGVAVDFAGQPPTIIDGRTLVPVRAVFEALDFDVDWDQQEQMVTLARSDFEIRIIIGQPTFGIDDLALEATGSVELDVPAQIIGGRTLLPIRALLEAVGYEVDWDGENQTVLVFAPTAVEEEEEEEEAPEASYIFIRGQQIRTDVTFLDFDGMGLTTADIFPLQYMTHLETLILSDNNITSITPLADLTTLTDLWLADNNISDITPLAGLVNLESLGLSQNQITDISALADLSNLEHLSLFGNQVGDITTRLNMPLLESLSLGNQGIGDISGLAGLTGLTSLTLNSNEISDISVLAGLTNLESLSLWSNEITDIAPLAGLVNLTDLTLFNNQIIDITPLAGLVNLEDLRLGSNLIFDLSPLAGLTNLTELSVSSNLISDLAPLSGLVNLTDLNISSNNITNLRPLFGLSNLENLNVGISFQFDFADTLRSMGLGQSQLEEMGIRLSDLGIGAGTSFGNNITDWSPVRHVENVIGRP